MVNPARGDVVANWLKALRDQLPKGVQPMRWMVIDSIMDEYRKHADYGIPLDAELPEEWGMM